MRREPVVFDCAGDALLGVLHGADDGATRGALIVVGGPQYRVGSHRQFYHLADALARAGVPTLRFDYRGMGDSDGAMRDFEDVDDDIEAAIDALFERTPGLREVVLVGLCDAASAALMYAPRDARVSGLAIMNPWVRGEDTLARSTVRHYYLRRLISREFWRKLLRGGVRVGESLRSLGKTLRAARGGGAGGDGGAKRPFRERMLSGAQAFDGRLLLIQSGDDLTAAEFDDYVKTEPAWQEVLARPGVTRHDLAGANHTFSSAAWRGEVEQWIAGWARETA